jgi:hypothetical protein
MPLSYSMFAPADAARFKSSHWTFAKLPDDKYMITLTGVVIIDFKGTGGLWLRDKASISIKLPSHLFPGGKWFQVQYWAPFVTLNAISNQNHAVNAGWAVDEFGGPGANKYYDGITIWANVAIRDVDGYLLRLGYSVNLVGEFTEPPPGPD